MREHKLLSEDELRQRKLRSYKEGATKLVKGTGKVIFGLGKSIVDGFNYLGKQGQRSKGGEPLDMSVDLGFGRNKAQRKYQGELDEISKRAKILRVRRKIKAKRARRNRFA